MYQSVPGVRRSLPAHAGVFNATQSWRTNNEISNDMEVSLGENEERKGGKEEEEEAEKVITSRHWEDRPWSPCVELVIENVRSL